MKHKARHRHKVRHGRKAVKLVASTNTTSLPAPGTLVGENTVESHSDYVNAGEAEAFRVQAVTSGVTGIAHVYLDSHNSARTLIVGLYASSSSAHPDSLLSTGSISTVKAGAWNSVSLAPSSLEVGRTYWLAVLGEQGTLRYRDRRNGPCPSETSAQTSLGSLPASWKTGRTYADCPVSAYVTAAEPVLSAPITEEPHLAAPTDTALPTISGTTTEGQVLSSTDGTWSGSPTSYAHQWQDCDATGANCSSVAGATGSSYTLTSTDTGHMMRVVVTASNEGGSASASSAATAPVAATPPPPGPPTASFTYSPSAPVVGQSVTFDGSSSTCPNGPCTYAWSDDGSTTQPMVPLWPLGSGQTFVYTFTATGTKYVRLVVTDATGQTATVEHNVVVEASSPPPPPPPSAPSNTTAPSVSGIAQVGQTLTASNGTWSGSAPIGYAYQWQGCDSSGNNCGNMTGAVTAGHTLTASDVGHTIRVVVTASNEGGSAAAASSVTATVASEPSEPPPPPPPPPGMPAPLAPAGSSTCSVTVSSSSAATSAVRSAAAGTVVCLGAGSYSGLELSGAHSGDVTVQPVPGAKATINVGVTDAHGSTVAVYVAQSSSHIIVHGFYVTDAVEIDQGSSFVRIDHNDIGGGFDGVQLMSEDCTAPHAPKWSGCGPMPPVTDVTISGNRIHNIGGPTGDDAININNWRRVRVTGNEITSTIEGGDHTDCLQSTFGGTEITFDRNYEHDNQCQGFFLKDGDVTGAIVYDNLFLRDQVAQLNENNIQVFDTYGLVLRNNTNWSGNGDILRAPDGTSYTATVDHNVSPVFSNGCCSETTFQLTEGYNLFGKAPWTFSMSSTDAVSAAPQFVDPAHDDYRLANNPNGIGIDWAPSGSTYGPTGS